MTNVTSTAILAVEAEAGRPEDVVTEAIEVLFLYLDRVLEVPVSHALVKIPSWLLLDCRRFKTEGLTMADTLSHFGVEVIFCRIRSLFDGVETVVERSSDGCQTVFRRFPFCHGFHLKTIYVSRLFLFGDRSLIVISWRWFLSEDHLETYFN